MRVNHDYLLLCDLLDDVVVNRNNLGTPLFNKLGLIVPMVAVEIIFFNDRNEFLMTYREDEHFEGWHFPGRILRFGSDFDHELRQLCEKELGVTRFDCSFLFPMNYNKHIKRGHVVSMVFSGALLQEPRRGEWFSEIPPDAIEDHADLYWFMVENMK